jgi:hypothetical protein
MIDVNKNPLIILPKEHISLKDFDYSVAVEKKNKLLEKAIFGIIATGVIALIYYTIKYADERYKKQD